MIYFGIILLTGDTRKNVLKIDHVDIYWVALSLSFRQIYIMLMNIIAWGPQVSKYVNDP